MLQVQNILDFNAIMFLTINKGIKLYSYFLNFRINLREFQFAQTMMFAIEEINNSSSLLPKIKIGYKIFDSCGLTLPSTHAVMHLINGQEKDLVNTCQSKESVHVIIGASESSSTIAILQISGSFQIPVVKFKYVKLMNYF